MLIIRTDNGDFDLFGDETIVQTLSMFNLSDLTSRGGEYSNVFNLPLTNNNRRLIEYADFIPSINTTPYKKISCTLIIDGLEYKEVFMVMEPITNTIQVRFYSGNSSFFDLVKSRLLTSLNWSDYDHIWNYTNAVASSANTTGYTYPVVDYGNQNTSSDIIDIRYVLPATFGREILNRMLSQLGYTAILNFNTSDLDVTIFPYSKKNPSVSAEILLLNQVDLSNTVDYFPIIPDETVTNPVGNQIIGLQSEIPLDYQVIDTVGSSGYYDDVTRKFTAGYSGVYTYTLNADLDDYEYTTLNFSPAISQPNIFSETIMVVFKEVGGVETNINQKSIATSQFVDITSTLYTSVTPLILSSISGTITGTVYLNQGESLRLSLANRILYPVYTPTSTISTNITVVRSPQVVYTNTLNIDLSPGLVFGGLITYSSMLPDIKCSEFLKDLCIRFGLILSVNEDTKVITINKFDIVEQNIPNAIDWSDKLDESTPPDIQFKYDSYCQNNIFKHAPDKTISSTPDGSDYTLTINNQNLELEKVIYQSPFSVTENVTFTNGVTTSRILLYNTVNSKFDRDITARICFSEPVVGLFKFTDGTSTSGYIDTNRIWFIDQSLPDLSMGFGLSLIPKNSITLINILQNLRIVKANFNLNLIDILNLDYFIPIYVEQFQSYFFISSINQYNYTEHDLTEVELIKLN